MFLRQQGRLPGWIFAAKRQKIFLTFPTPPIRKNPIVLAAIGLVAVTGIAVYSSNQPSAGLQGDLAARLSCNEQVKTVFNGPNDNYFYLAGAADQATANALAETEVRKLATKAACETELAKFPLACPDYCTAGTPSTHFLLKEPVVVTKADPADPFFKGVKYNAAARAVVFVDCQSKLPCMEKTMGANPPVAKPIPPCEKDKTPWCFDNDVGAGGQCVPSTLMTCKGPGRFSDNQCKNECLPAAASAP